LLHKVYGTHDSHILGGIGGCGDDHDCYPLFGAVIPLPFPTEPNQGFSKTFCIFEIIYNLLYLLTNHGRRNMCVMFAAQAVVDAESTVPTIYNPAILRQSAFMGYKHNEGTPQFWLFPKG